MSEINRKRRMSPPPRENLDGAQRLEGNHSMCADVLIESCAIKANTEQWEGIGENDVFDKLQLDRQYITVPDDALTAFIADAPGGFQFQPFQPEQQYHLDTYFTILNKYINFDVMDADIKVNNINYQYGGYDRKLGYGTKTSAQVYEVFSDFESCFLEIEKAMPNEMVQAGLGHLIKYCPYAMDFVNEATQILLRPTEWQEPAFVDLFRVFSRLAGLQLKDAACEAARHFKIFGKQVSGRPDLRAYVPIDRESWWRHKPASARTMPLMQTLTAVVKVKHSPPVKSDSVELQTERYLAQVVGEMLSELLSTQPHVPVAASQRSHLLGVMVLSTKVYFVKLYVPQSLMEKYRSPASSCQDRDIERGTVYVTQGFDFMKRRSRIQVLKILHKIGTIIP